MPGLPWFTAEPDCAPRAPSGPDDRQFHGALGRRSVAVDRQAALPRQCQDRLRGPGPGDFATASLYAKRRSRLSRARALGENLERWRIATHPAGGPARFE